MDSAGLYQQCLLCPRACGVDRAAGQRGFCGESQALRIAAAVLHRGEEPPLSGRGGSGTIFVTGCNLGCVFCQNHQISRAGMGRPVSAETFAGICLELRDRGAENINIVTGSHAVPAIVRGISAARRAGLAIPVLWNSSAYETVETLELLKDHVDMYLPDLKTLDSALAARFFKAPDYPRVAAGAILKMIDMRDNSARTVIIRHLALPGCLDSTREVLRWFAGHARGRALLSLMTQYTPIPALADGPGRFLGRREYETIMGWLEEFGIEDGFCQELLGANDWLPDFTRPNPFPSALSVPVWHWREHETEAGDDPAA
jgi:putative pyruvate formate lyase activating enzyme